KLPARVRQPVKDAVDIAPFYFAQLIPAQIAALTQVIHITSAAILAAGQFRAQSRGETAVAPRQVAGTIARHTPNLARQLHHTTGTGNGLSAKPQVLDNFALATPGGQLPTPLPQSLAQVK